MAKIRYSDEFICPKCGSHTALVCRIDGTYQSYCMICDVYYDVEIAKPITNADRIRNMSDEKLATFIVMNGYGSCPIVPICPQYDKGKPYTQDGCIKCWGDWLKAEVEDE